MNTDTLDINFDANADAFKTAAQGSGIIDTVENPVRGTWAVKTTRPDSEEPQSIHVHTNKLGPVSFVRVRQFKQFGVWWFECRLIQAPLTFNSGDERVLPVPPAVRRIRDGSAGSETEPPVNELQALHLPPDFRGTYFLRWNYRVSKLLGIDDGPDEIAAALNAMFEKGKRFEATNPEPDNAYVEFIGNLGGSPQPLITVEDRGGLQRFGGPLWMEFGKFVPIPGINQFVGHMRAGLRPGLACAGHLAPDLDAVLVTANISQEPGKKLGTTFFQLSPS